MLYFCSFLHSLQPVRDAFMFLSFLRLFASCVGHFYLWDRIYLGLCQLYTRKPAQQGGTNRGVSDLNTFSRTIRQYRKFVLLNTSVWILAMPVFHTYSSFSQMKITYPIVVPTLCWLPEIPEPYWVLSHNKCTSIVLLFYLHLSCISVYLTFLLFIYIPIPYISIGICVYNYLSSMIFIVCVFLTLNILKSFLEANGCLIKYHSLQDTHLILVTYSTPSAYKSKSKTFSFMPVNYPSWSQL